jgi:hypothetical protein
MATLKTQEQFEKLRAKLKAGDYADRPELQAELISAAKEWKSRASVPAVPAVPQGGSAFDSLGKGAMFGFADEIAGAGGAAVNSALGLFGKGTGESFGDAYRGVRDAARYNEQAFSQRNPGGSLALEMAGGILTGGAGAAKAGAFGAATRAPSVLGKLAPVAATGAIQGGLYGAGASDRDTFGGVAGDTLKGAAIGGATAPILPALAAGARSAVSGMAQPAANSPAYQKAIGVLRDKVGIDRFTTGQKTGSNPIKALETTLGETFLGHSIGSSVERARKQVQKKLMKMAGFAADDVEIGEVTADAIENAASEFNRKYNAIIGNRSVRLNTNEFLDDLIEVQTIHGNMQDFEQIRKIKQITESLFDQATDGPITAKAYQRIRSSLGKNEANAADGTIKGLYRSLKGALDDAFHKETGLGPAKRAVDGQYNRFTKLRDTYNSSVSIQTSGGDLPFSTVLKKAMGGVKGKYKADKDFIEILRSAQTVLGDPTPNSATASRQHMLGWLEGGAVGGGATASILTANPAPLVASIGGPVAASMALSRGLTGSPTVDKLIQSGLLTAPMTVPAAQRLAE